MLFSTATPKREEEPGTVYKTVDFIKTEAFNRTRQKVEEYKYNIKPESKWKDEINPSKTYKLQTYAFSRKTCFQKKANIEIPIMNYLTFRNEHFSTRNIALWTPGNIISDPMISPTWYIWFLSVVQLDVNKLQWKPLEWIVRFPTYSSLSQCQWNWACQDRLQMLQPKI